MPDELSTALVGLQKARVVELVQTRITRGEEPLSILEQCRLGMSLVGERFQAGEYYLAELLLSAEIFKTAVNLLEPHLKKGRPSEPVGRMVLATMQGDIHDLGKNIFATLLRAHAFEVHDVGVDVPPALLVDKVKEVRPHFVAFSALLTTAFRSMKEAAEMLSDAGLRQEVKLLVGGGVTAPAVRDYVGADFQSTDAMAGVAYCLRTAPQKGAGQAKA